MSVNPFDKSKFHEYRDWEESLVRFFVLEAKSPNVAHWLSMAKDAESPRTVAYSALLLSNLVASRPHYSEAAKTLYTVYEALNGKSGEASEFEAWLRSDWLNVSRVANMFKAELAHY